MNEIMNHLFALIMALLAYTMVSLGGVLMKKGVGWREWSGRKDGGYYRLLGWWVLGFLVMNIYGVPSAVALRYLPAHVVGACAGWGIAAMVFFAWWILGETLKGRDIGYVLLIAGGIALLNFSARPVPANSPDMTALTVLGIIPVAIYGVAFCCGGGRKERERALQIRTVAAAAASGFAAGLMVVFLKLLVTLYQYNVAFYPRSLHFYLYLFYALLSFIALQTALRSGPIMTAGPVQYAGAILYPVPATLWVFRGEIAIGQYAAAALIVWAAARLLRGRWL